jgi:hypothetical protein
MFDYQFHPYLRWLRGRSRDDVPGPNTDRNGLPPQTFVQLPANLPTPEPEGLPPSALPADLANFAVEQPNEIPGFRVGLPDDVPGFNVNENDLPPPERAPPPESSDIAKTSTLPPTVEDPEPAPQLPNWLYNVLTMPVPRLSTAFDPQTGRRIIPNEPLVNWTRPYPTVDQNMRETGPGTYGPRVTTGPSSLEAPSIRQWASPVTPEEPADPNARPDSPRTIVPEATRNRWSQPLQDAQTDVNSSSGNAENPWRSVMQPQQQQTPVPQEQRTRLSDVPETAFGKEPVGIQPTPLNGASPIEFSVYNPDVDPRYDKLFDVVQDVRENRIQGNAAKDAVAEQIKKAYPNVPFAQEIQIHAKGLPGYMTADILFRPNGTSAIMIFEVKSGDARLSSQQLEKLAHAVRTGEVYIVNEKAAKEFGLRPYETFASKSIIPEVYITGGNQDAIARQLQKLGIEVIPEKGRRGQIPRLRLRIRPT